MPDLNQLRNHARQIFDYALASVDPREAVKSALTVDGSVVRVGGQFVDVSTRRIYAIALGKAAAGMAHGLDEALGDRLTAGVITAPEPLARPRWTSFAGGHPLPNEASLAAARAAFALLERANSEQAVVFFLISGGGSAMLEWPVAREISLADLRTANQVLVNCGASIAEVNSIRRALSAVKGGGLARRAAKAKSFTLIVSDTNSGDEANVASGPTLASSRSAAAAQDVVERYQLATVLPRSIMNAIQRDETSPSIVQGFHVVLLDNDVAVEAARKKARQLGFAVEIARDISEQPIELGCGLLLARLPATETSSCLLSGGEFLCPVRGPGRGGRNLETALRCAIGLPQVALDKSIVILSAGTDGVDGNSAAAGAIADETTIIRAQKLGLDPVQFLAKSDSYSFFAQTKDLIVTGPTGTNVRDLRILLRAS